MLNIVLSKSFLAVAFLSALTVLVVFGYLGLWSSYIPIISLNKSNASNTPRTLSLTGDIVTVHDPMMVKIGGKYYIFSSGSNISVRTSSNLLNWKYVGEVFDGSPQRPSWIHEKIPTVEALWAPDVSYFGGTYHMYYSASAGGGSMTSCIGHVTFSGELDSYEDMGSVICSNVDSEDDWNAIDPNVVTDENGTPWLSFGSWATGIKMIKLDTSGNRADNKIYPLAFRSWSKGIEASFIIRHGDYYYLFVSWDKCCRGIRSTYNIRVGRSKNILGPYKDKRGIPMLNGGGTLVLKGSFRWRGPGHNAVLMDGQKIYNVYHAYDTYRNGKSVLRISEMIFDSDNWPISGGP